MVIVFALVALLVLSVLVAGNWWLWRRLFRDTTRGPGFVRRAGVLVIAGGWTLTIGALVAERSGAPFWLQQVLAWPGFLWLALSMYLMLGVLAGEVVRPLLRRWLERRARAGEPDPVPGPVGVTPATSPETGTADRQTLSHGSGPTPTRTAASEAAPTAVPPGTPTAGSAAARTTGSPTAGSATAPTTGSTAAPSAGITSATRTGGASALTTDPSPVPTTSPSPASVTHPLPASANGSASATATDPSPVSATDPSPTSANGSSPTSPNGSAPASANGSASATAPAPAPTPTAPAPSRPLATPTRRLFVSRVVAGAAAAAAVGTVGYGSYGVLRGPKVKRVTVPLAKLPRAAHGYRIAVVSDVHLGPVLGRGFAQKVVDTINGTQPDMIAVVGDLVDGSVKDLGPAAAPLAGLRARHGAFFVTGNHEYFSGAEQWVEEVRRLGLRPLENARTELPHFDLAGVNDVAGESEGQGPDFAKALGDRDTARACVLLAHQPIQIHDAVDHGVDLQLSGHTHGGQLWPGNLVAEQANPTLAGLERYGDTQLYVSRGAGAWGPPTRVGAPSDITVIELASRQA
ncbi:metallophosphoesterase [Streptomyces sp. NPDC012935]|uniref:metallophosphoesterase n=1 Tax=Streptomyces sp. NPDC012935 TaxID=3364857 RepID=UPI003684F468